MSANDPQAEQRKEEFHRLLALASEVKASDIHLKPGKGAVVRINGQLLEVDGFPEIRPGMIAAYARMMMNERQAEEFRARHDIDLAYSVAGVGRYRVNIFQQRGTLAMALRAIPYDIGTIEELNLPPVLEKIAMERRGMVLVTGSTGSGKSTTLASMVDFINRKRTAHIITIEDPIEYLLRDKKSMIAQREIGFDSMTFHAALRAAMRQDPDVILVGEMRDIETITTALMAAETGHLVLATLHTTDVMETIHRIIAFFDAAQSTQIRFQMATVLRAIMCQRLIPTVDGKGRVPAVEVMISTKRISELIKDPKRTHEITDAISGGYATYGMQTFDMALLKLVIEKKISYEEALQNASNPGDFSLKMKGISSTADADIAEFQRLQSVAAKERKEKEGDEPRGNMVIERFSK
jgi:twitching motility protein PilT